MDADAEIAASSGGMNRPTEIRRDAPASFYVGSVMHARLRPKAHRFRYRTFMALFDLAELDGRTRISRLFSLGRLNLMSFHERDHLPDAAGATLLERARSVFASNGIDAAELRIFLLALPRVCGYAFNPISVYYAVDRGGDLKGALYEVRNTFGERCVYSAAAEPGRTLGPHEFDKALHVSPFLPMALRYRFRTAMPDAGATLKIVESDPEGVILTAIFAGARREATDANVIRLFFSLPFVTLKVILGIHWEALRLLAKGLKIHPHPSSGRKTGTSEPMARSGSSISETQR
ncbi:MAG: DUF1365 domain-containing protein [Salinarimonadaceae bacterium]|nr:MAG: DUF1365 domain-containing protein [Salinarimonadaceae bacterium]